MVRNPGQDVAIPEQADVDKTPSRIARMFDSIAPRYDLLNHVLSAGLDRRWRVKAIAALQLPPSARVLDLCTGTGDLAVRGLHPTAVAWIVLFGMATLFGCTALLLRFWFKMLSLQRETRELQAKQTPPALMPQQQHFATPLPPSRFHRWRCT